MKPIDLRQLLKKIHALVDIEWLHSNDAPVPDAPAAAPELTARLPAGCDIDELIQLGEIGHVTRILERLGEIENGAPECREFIGRMRSIVNAFDFRRYVAALQEVRDAHA
jgi:hypothetical protein